MNYVNIDEILKELGTRFIKVMYHQETIIRKILYDKNVYLIETLWVYIFYLSIIYTLKKL